MFENQFGQNIKSELKETNNQIISQTTGFISSGFMLIAALAWNEAIKALINLYFPAVSGIVSLFVYALLITLIAVIVTSHLNKIGARYQNEAR